MKKILILLMILLMTGCYDYNELDDLKIVSSMLIDYKNGEYNVSIEILNTNKEKETPTYFLNGSGKTFEESLNNIYLESTDQLYFSQMYTVILSKSVAEDHLVNLYDFFTRDTDIRKDFYVFITEDTEEFEKFKTDENMSIGETLKNSFEYNEKKNAKYTTCNFREILNSYLNNKNFFLGSIKISEKNISLENTYLMHNNKLIQKIDENAVLFINLLKTSDSTFQIQNSNTYEIFQYILDRKIKTNKIYLNFKATAKLLNMNNVPSSTVKDIEKIENNLEITFQKYFKDCIEYARNIGFDLYNFNYYYYLYYPNSVNNETWKTIEYHIDARIKINEKGLILDSLGGLNEK